MYLRISVMVEKDRQGREKAPLWENHVPLGRRAEQRGACCRLMCPTRLAWRGCTAASDKQVASVGKTTLNA